MIQDILGLDPVKESKKDIIIGYEKLEEPNDCDTIIDFVCDLIDEVVADNYGPLIICFDDAQLFDENSWEVLQELVEEKKSKVMFLVKLNLKLKKKKNQNRQLSNQVF